MRFCVVTAEGLRPLPIPANAKTFEDLLAGLPLGVYSALRTFDHNKFLSLDAHLARMEQSMRLLGWSETLDQQTLRAALHQAVTAVPWPESRVRFDLLAQPAPARLGTDSRLLIALMELTPPPPELYAQGVKVGIAAGLQRHNPLAKTADFTQRRAQFLQTQSEVAYEYLLLDDAGRILEGTSTNFWGIRAGTLITAGEGVLEGVTRKIILQLAAELRIPVQFAAIPLAEVATLDEAALSGSSRAFLPVVQIGEQVVGNGSPGPLSQTILAAYLDFVQREAKTAVASS